ncbi:helix-turn-helix transcriptional regulator [Pectobacterium brasiliense]|uniref:helix-turn-helix transcriptional regulator n=1 Tax=Pectobacterium brasiliense TaxID=180957 RepID=UPI00068F2C32|nr:hypothetical protein [Pectobacterium brasiliense]
MTAYQATQSTIPATGYIRRFRMPGLLGISMPTIDHRVKSGILPHPIKLTDNVIVFNVVNINNWLSVREKRPNEKEKPFTPIIED